MKGRIHVMSQRFVLILIVQWGQICNMLKHGKSKRKAVFIDEETHAKIKEKAQKNNRSMAKQLKEDYQLCNK